MLKKHIIQKIMLIFLFLFLISLGYTSYIFIKSILYFDSIENILRYSIIGITGMLFIIMIINLFLVVPKNKFKSYFLYILAIIFFAGIQYFVAFNLNKFIFSTEKLTGDLTTYSTSLISLKNSDIDNINDLEGKKVGIISNKKSIDGYVISMEMIEKYKIDKDFLVYYDDFLFLLDALYNKEVDAIFISSSYKTMFSNVEGFENIASNVKIIKKMKKYVKKKSNSKALNKPFSILVMGVDSEKDGLKSGTSFNGDTLILMTFNPNTSNATILSIPRDTYVPIACLKNKSKKINSASWYGTDCMIDTIENLVGINIDYWIKINFKGVVELVDALGGVEVDVPYTFCEQDSNRLWGENTIFVKKGLQTINGEQALALSRHRKISSVHFDNCSKEYTKYTYVNDFVRGQSQQLVINGIVNKAKDIKSLNKIYDLLNIVENNMETNLKKNVILSSYDTFKNIISISSNITSMDFIGTQRLYLSGYDAYLYDADSKLNLYEFIYYKGSLKDISKAMKINLEVINPTLDKELYFSIKKPYKSNYIGKGYYKN